MRLGLALGLSRHNRVISTGLNPQTKLWIERAGDEGFALPSKDNQRLVSILVDALISGNAWNLTDCIPLYATDAVSGNIGRINLYKPSDPLGSYVNAITYNRKQGVKGDGVSAYIDTGFTPSTYGGNYSNNDASIGAYVFSQSTVGSHEFISNNGANGALRIRNANTVVQRINCNSNLSPAINFGTTGFLMAHKTSALSVTGQVNATLTSHVYGSNTTNTPDGNVVLLAQTGLAAFCDAGISLFIAGGNISSSALSVNTAVSNYMNALSLLP